MSLTSETTLTWTEHSSILKPSSFGGIGVFATHDLLPGTIVRLFSEEVPLKKAKLKEIPEAFHKFCIFINDEEVICPHRFDHLENGWYLNHSHQPNIRKIGINDAITLRYIVAGEEILLDYNELNEPDHLKETYYK